MTIKLTQGEKYSVIEVDLSIAHNNEELFCPGDVLSVMTITGELSIRFDEPDNPLIELHKVVRVVTKPYTWKYIYFTNTAQPGKTAILYVGREASFEAIPIRAGAVGIVDTTGVQINPALAEHTQALVNDAIKGLLRSIGDAGANPLNNTGATVLRRLYNIDLYTYMTRVRFEDPGDAETFTTTPLGAGATYYSPARDFFYSRLGHAGCIGFADQPSDTNGVYAQLSIDGTNWDYIGVKDTASANVGVSLRQEVTARYVRFVWKNGPNAQTVFRFGGRYYI